MSPHTGQVSTAVYVCRLLDAFLVDSPATSIALSPSGDFLCSTHVDDLGIYLWSNRTLYSHVSLRPLLPDHTPSLLCLPNTGVAYEEAQKNEDEDEYISNLDVPAEDGDDITLEEKALTPISEGLVTLSNLPKSRWHNLQQLDVIRKHNKPLEPPKQPKKAPFFLSTSSGLQPKFVSSQDGDEEVPGLEGDGGSKILNLGKLLPLSEFQSALQHCAAIKQCKCTEKIH